MTGIVQHWNDERTCGCIIADKEKFFTFRAYIEADELGRRFLLRGETVSFDVGNDNKGRIAAVSVRPLHRAPVDVSAYAGEYCVVRLDARFAQRPIGGQVYLPNSLFQRGNVILVKTFCKPHREHDCWHAGDATLIAQTEEEFEANQCSQV